MRVIKLDQGTITILSQHKHGPNVSPGRRGPAGNGTVVEQAHDAEGDIEHVATCNTTDDPEDNADAAS